MIVSVDELRSLPGKRVLVIGNFDGVHVGHQRLIAKALEHARREGLEATALTFWPHPMKVFGKTTNIVLTPLDEKIRLLKFFGIDRVVVLKFDESLYKMSPSTFLDDVVIGKLRALIVVVGEDFRFGSGRKGDVKYMRQYLKTYGVYVEDVPQVSFGDVPVSSTRIRRLIREGKVEVAWQMLGRPYKVIGAVVRGKGRGRIIGFPTANIVPENEVIPKDGVYAVFVDLGDSLYKGVANIGNNPTFGDVERSLEIHLLGFFGDLYGARIGVYFARRLRGEKKFGTIEELKDAIRKDIFAMRSCLEWESLSFGRVL